MRGWVGRKKIEGMSRIKIELRHELKWWLKKLETQDPCHSTEAKILSRLNAGETMLISDHPNDPSWPGVHTPLNKIILEIYFHFILEMISLSFKKFITISIESKRTNERMMLILSEMYIVGLWQWQSGGLISWRTGVEWCGELKRYLCRKALK